MIYGLEELAVLTDIMARELKKWISDSRLKIVDLCLGGFVPLENTPLILLKFFQVGYLLCPRIAAI